MSQVASHTPSSEHQPGSAATESACGDAASVAVGPADPVAAMEGDRLSIDMDRLCVAESSSADDGLLGDLITTMTWRSAMLPGGRVPRTSVRWAIARQLFEERAFELRNRHGVCEIVDAGLQSGIDRIVAGDARSAAPTIIMTNPARLLERRPGRIRRLAHRVSEAKPWGRAHRIDVEHPVAPGVRGTEYVDLGDGWLETDSGNRRHRRDTVTLLFREPGTTGRLDVRVVGVERILRLRFTGIEHPAFVRFWSRWSADAD